MMNSMEVVRQHIPVFTDSHLRTAALEHLRPQQQAKLVAVERIAWIVDDDSNEPVITNTKPKTNKERRREEDDDMFWRALAEPAARKNVAKPVKARPLAALPAPRQIQHMENICSISVRKPEPEPAHAPDPAIELQSETETESGESDISVDLLHSKPAISTPAIQKVPTASVPSSSLASTFIARRGRNNPTANSVLTPDTSESAHPAPDVVPPTPAPVVKRLNSSLNPRRKSDEDKPRKRFNASDFLDTLF
ncbi:UNVERIFIED_CONTAM: hypothetical protein HDU68_011860 [Siphonaria sp. JEL0065]|nr:hypothetical protein HDU68_011860 [Siphonaria sp. JEL0065]